MSILRADSIRDRAGTGAPDFPNGLTGNLTGTATTATTLSGTPNISVGTLGCGDVTSTGDVTGVNATFSGNLTVQGTTTTIDTAVTAVDSLAVDGQVTALGSLGIGTDSPVSGVKLHLQDTSACRLQLSTDNTGHTSSDGVRLMIDSSDNFEILQKENANIEFFTNDTERVQITGGGTAIFKAGLAEKSNRVTGSLGSNPNNSITDGNIIFFNGYNESGNLTINFTDIHANLGVHECCSFTVIISPNGSGVITTVTIDGQTPADGLKWSGGSAPSAGASGVDIYTFTIRKYDVGNTAYSVFGAATNYA